MNQDWQLYKKAKGRVLAHMFFYWVTLAIYFIFSYLFLSEEMASIPDFSRIFVVLAFGQILLFTLLFSLLSIGNKWIRWLYWIGLFLDCALFYIPFRMAFQDFSHVIFYAKYIFLMIIKVMFLFQIGLYLFRNKYCKIFYERVISIEGDDYELNLYSDPVPYVREDEQDIPNDEESDFQEKKEVIYTYPQISLRLGFCVYGSVILFPAFTILFGGLFTSMNMQSVFATKEIFIQSIFSAFIWTIPIFFLYYNQDTSQKCIKCCIGVEILANLWYLFRLKTYFDVGDYSIRVFVFFIVLDILRYILLAYFIKPVFLQEKKEPNAQ